jgi:CelD/BcsL family acetyltransferase involved in cellulose biosynthesis
MRVRIIEHIGDFAALHEEWNHLLSRSNANTVFLTWEWLYSWWEHFSANRKLSIMLVYDEDKLVGIAPFYYESTRIRGLIPMKSLQWLGAGDVGSDYLNLICETGYEEQVCDLICRELSGNIKSWDLLRLTDLPDRSPAFLRFQELTAGDTNLEYQIGREYICPYIELENHSTESYLESLSSNMRYNLRRRSRQVFQQLGAEMRRCERLEEIGSFLDAIFELHARRWKARGGSDGFSGTEIRAFHQTAAERLFARGWLRLYMLEIDNLPVAGIYGIEYANTFSFYQSGFDPACDRYSVGMVLMFETIKEAINRKMVLYDFLHGTEEYKFKWTQTVRRTQSLMIYPRNRLAPRLYFLLRNVKERLRTKEVIQQPEFAS